MEAAIIILLAFPKKTRKQKAAIILQSQANKTMQKEECNQAVC